MVSRTVSIDGQSGWWCWNHAADNNTTTRFSLFHIFEEAGIVVLENTLYCSSDPTEQNGADENIAFITGPPRRVQL